MAQSVSRVKPSYHQFCLLLAASLIVALSATSAIAQRKTSAPSVGQGDAATASFNAYRGIQLGMTADEVRKKLGDPKDKGTEQDFYVFNETETAQIVYDKSQKVITISADFLTSGAGVLTAKDVLGSDVEPKADGSVYKMVRFPKAGYWVSYNRTSGATPMTTVTLQKID